MKWELTSGCSCLRNAVSLFSFIEKEWAWRREHGRPEGFETLKKTKPIGMIMSFFSGKRSMKANVRCSGCRCGGAVDRAADGC